MAQNRASLRQQREDLWRKDPHCYWCGRLTIPPPDAGNKRKFYPLNEATIDHLHSRWSQHRLNGGKGKHVLACRECNQRRDREQMRWLMEQNPKVVWARTGAYPIDLTGQDLAVGC